MSKHTIVNLLDLPDVVGGRVEGLTGRFGRTALESRDLGVSLWRYEPGVRTGGHAHTEQEEAYVVVSGSGRILLDGEIRDIGQWDVVRVAPAVVRAFEAGPDGMELLAVGGPQPEAGDGSMVDVTWPA